MEENKEKSRPRAWILLDKNDQTSFGRVAETVIYSLKSFVDVQIVHLRSPQYFSDDQGTEGFHIDAPHFLAGRFLWPPRLRKLLADQNGTSAPDWILIIRPELSFCIPHIRKVSAKTKISVMVHDTFAETLYPNSLKFKLINRYFISPIAGADASLFNSEYTRQCSHEHFGIIGKTETICGCVINPGDFYPTDQDKDQLRIKWNLTPMQGVYTNVSLDEPRKNIRVFFDVAKRMPHAQFLRIGKLSQWMEEYLEEQEIRNVVHLSGLNVKELREIYNLSDVLFYPSELEGFGLPPLEALCCHTPALTSGSSALRENLAELIPQVMPPDNVEEYVRILKLYEKKSVKTDWKKVRAKLAEFSPESFAVKMLDHIEKVL